MVRISVSPPWRVVAVNDEKNIKGVLTDR